MKSNRSENKDLPGYIKFNFVPNNKPYTESSPEEKTNLIIKVIESDKLPYEQFYKDKDQINKFGGQFAKGERISAAQLLLRADHVPPGEILKNGGFQPHAIKSGRYPHKTDHILNPIEHAMGSEQSGLVSCTYNLHMSKAYNANRPDTYIYLVKAVGGFSGTNFREDEYEITVPAGIDAEDIIAFRKIHGQGDPSIFDPEKPLYIRESFLRRYPALIDYILKRYMESNESCPEATKILSNLVGDEKNHLPVTTPLATIQSKIIECLTEFINSPGISSPHVPRAQAVIKAVKLAKSLDDVWYTLNNQYDLFKNSTPDFPSGTITILNLKSEFYSDRHVNRKNSEDYIKTIEKALNLLPLENPLSKEKMAEADSLLQKSNNLRK